MQHFSLLKSLSPQGEALPAWLTFQASNMTFSGEAPQVQLSGHGTWGMVPTHFCLCLESSLTIAIAIDRIEMIDR